MELEIKYLKKLIALICLSLLMSPTSACAQEIITKLSVGEPSPYLGVLMPEDNFRFYVKRDRELSEYEKSTPNSSSNIISGLVGFLAGFALYSVVIHRP